MQVSGIQTIARGPGQTDMAVKAKTVKELITGQIDMSAKAKAVEELIGMTTNQLEELVGSRTHHEGLIDTTTQVKEHMAQKDTATRTKKEIDMEELSKGILVKLFMTLTTEDRRLCQLMVAL